MGSCSSRAQGESDLNSYPVIVPRTDIHHVLNTRVDSTPRGRRTVISVTGRRRTEMALSPSVSPRSPMQGHEDLVRARRIRHGPGQSAASFEALSQLHAPHISELRCDAMREACVALSEGKGPRGPLTWEITILRKMM